MSVSKKNLNAQCIYGMIEYLPYSLIVQFIFNAKLYEIIVDGEELSVVEHLPAYKAQESI